MTDPAAVAQPVAKAASALGMGAGTSALSVAAGNASFLPTDLAGWLACLASFVAVCYTLTLWGEWWYKKFWRSRFERWGWVTPHHGRRT